MKSETIFYCIIFVLMVACTTNNNRRENASDDIHMICQIHENGDWVNIKDAPVKCGYLLHDNKVYGVAIDVPIDTINWDVFWKEFLAPQYDTIFIREKGKIVGYKIEDNTIRPISYVDIQSFKVSINSDGKYYAKDKNYVYCPTSFKVTDYNNYYDLTFEGDIRILGIDPKTFKYLGKGYAVDKKYMYWNGDRIKWNDHIITALQQSDCPEFLPIDYGLPNE